MDIRTGFGYDIHRLEKQEEGFFLLAQVKIKGNTHIVSHSDGEVLLHSLSNAILSALGKDDIGCYFPDNSEKTKDMNSLFILDFALSEMERQGYRLSNVVADIVLERPKLKPYRDDIKNNLAHFLHLDPSRIALHANTNEKVDAVGNEKAVIVYSQVLIIKE